MTVSLVGHKGERLARLAGVSYRQVDYWARIGVFGSQFKNPGSGGRRPWTTEMLEVLWACGRLAELGAKTDALVRAAEVVMARPVALDGEALVVTPDNAMRFDHWCIDHKIEAAWVIALRPLPDLIEAAA